MAHNKLHSYMYDYSEEPQNSNYTYKKVRLKIQDLDHNHHPVGPIYFKTVHLRHGVGLLGMPSITYVYDELYLNPVIVDEVHIQEGGKDVYDVTDNLGELHVHA